MAISVVLLTIAAGFCLLEHGDGDGAGHPVQDFCLGMLALSLGVVAIARLSAIGWAVSPPPLAAYVVARHAPEHPPRLALSR
jgi:hypothetical protein